MTLIAQMTISTSWLQLFAYVPHIFRSFSITISKLEPRTPKITQTFKRVVNKNYKVFKCLNQKETQNRFLFFLSR